MSIQMYNACGYCNYITPYVINPEDKKVKVVCENKQCNMSETILITKKKKGNRRS